MNYERKTIQFNGMKMKENNGMELGKEILIPKKSDDVCEYTDTFGKDKRTYNDNKFKPKKKDDVCEYFPITHSDKYGVYTNYKQFKPKKKEQGK